MQAGAGAGGGVVVDAAEFAKPNAARASTGWEGARIGSSTPLFAVRPRGDWSFAPGMDAEVLATGVLASG